MAKYVKSDSVEHLMGLYMLLTRKYPKANALFLEMCDKFYKLPTIDIVCCEDCKHGEVDASGMVICNNPNYSLKNLPDHFCRNGE